MIDHRVSLHLQGHAAHARLLLQLVDEESARRRQLPGSVTLDRLKSYEFRYEESILDSADKWKQVSSTAQKAHTCWLEENQHRMRVNDQQHTSFHQIMIEYRMVFVQHEESQCRRGLLREVDHFVTFAASNEPTWRQEAKQRELGTSIFSHAIEEKRRLFQSDCTEWFLSVQLMHSMEMEELRHRYPYRFV